MKKTKPIIAICIDGLDPEYLDIIETPNITTLIDNGFYKHGECIWPSVTNVNNVSILTGQYPKVHGICSNYRYVKETREEVYMESSEFILHPTIFTMAKNKGIKTLLATSKDKLRTLLGKDATNAISSEQNNPWLNNIIGPPPPIYSLEVNAWTIRAATYAIREFNPMFTYITTTDYAMHKYPPKSNESRLHLQLIDSAIGGLYNQFPEYSILITADHGMSDKTNLIDPGKILQEHGIESRPVPLIKDRYVVHHSNLGGGFFIYISEKNLHRAVKILNQVPGIDSVMLTEEAVSQFNLHPERIGQIIITGNKETVFGDSSQVQLPKGLRSHGSQHERAVPIIGYNIDSNYTEFTENRNVGTYVIASLSLV